MANRLILVRHPKKAGDKEGMYLGNAATLTEEGHDEIPLVIARLKLMGVDAVTCSVFPRAVTLAERIAEELKLPPPVRSDLFNEVDKPQFLVGMRREDPVHKEVMQAIRERFDRDRVPAGLLRGEKIKTRSEMEEEIRRLFLFVKNFRTDSPIPPDTLLAVTHAKKIAAILHYVYQRGSLKGYYKTTDHSVEINTAGITTLAFMPNRHTGQNEWKIRTLNDIVHLEIAYEEKLRSLIQKLMN